MTRRGRQTRRSKRGGKFTSTNSATSVNGGITTVAFHRFGPAALSGVTGNLTIPVNPQTNNLGCIAEVGDEFDLFRVIELMYRVHPMDPTDTVVQAMAYVPDIDVQTVTVGQLAQSPTAAVNSPFCGVPSPWMKVPRSQLKGMLDWYKCSPDAGAAEFESQGLIILAGGLSDNCTFELRGLIQFKNPVSAVVLLDKRIDRLVERGLVKRVSSTPQTPQPPTGLPEQPRAAEALPSWAQLRRLVGAKLAVEPAPEDE